MNESVSPNLYEIIVGVISTEKSVNASDKSNQFSFKVLRDSDKFQIRNAVEKIFNVKVLKVRTSNMKGKVKKFKQCTGKRSDWKKAVVTLSLEDDINMADFLGEAS